MARQQPELELYHALSFENYFSTTGVTTLYAQPLSELPVRCAAWRIF